MIWIRISVSRVPGKIREVEETGALQPILEIHLYSQAPIESLSCSKCLNGFLSQQRETERQKDSFVAQGAI